MRRLALLGVVAAVVVAVGAGTAAARNAPAAHPAQETDDALLAEGERLYETGCSSCHGVGGGGVTSPEGARRGPSLLRAGEAGAFYYLTTGRMPMANAEQQPVRKPPRYDEDEIEALVAYVASLGDGPELPDVDPEDGDVAEGGVIYRGTCAACHSASGAGGALSYGRAAPTLDPSTPLQVGAAVRYGPGQMPVFPPEQVSDQDLDDLAAYVEYLQHPDDPGGLPLARVGPIPEGFVAWLVGITAMLLFVFWIGNRRDHG